MGMLPFHVEIKEGRPMRSEMSQLVGSGVKLEIELKVLGSMADQGSEGEVIRSFVKPGQNH